MKLNARITTLAALFAVLAVGASKAAAEKKHVAFVLWDMEPRFIASKDGALEQMKKDGLAASEFDFTVNDVGHDAAKASRILAELVANKTDLYIPIGTVAALATVKAVGDKPVVFTQVYNPVEAGLVKDWKSSGNNVTGASNYVSLGKFLARLNDIFPGKKIGVLYTPGEKNSEIQMADLLAAAKRLKVETVQVPVKTRADIAALPAQLAGKADILFLTGSIPIGSNVAEIVQTAIKLKLITATHLDAYVDAGVLLGLTTDLTEVGRLTGSAVVRVLRGTAPSAVPVVFPPPKLLFNAVTAKAQGFDPPPALKEWIGTVVNRPAK